MPRECASCKQQPATVLARLHRDERSIVVPLCQQCLIRLSQKTRVEILETITSQESVGKKNVRQKAVHPIKRSKKPLLITVVVLLLLTSIVCSVIFIVPLVKKAIQKGSMGSTTESETVSDTPMTAEQIYEYASLATVEITAYNDDFVSTGTGFFCDTSEYLITNYHVIENATDAYITIHDGGRYDITGIYGYDAEKDIALLTTTYNSKSTIKSSTHEVSTGESVFVIGSSEGLTASFSSGIVANSRRDLDGHEFIQITAPISYGNSGGPVLNKFGEAIGILTAFFEEGQNLNLAIPISLITEVKKEESPLKNHNNSVVGVYVVKEIAGQPVDDYFAASLEEFGMEKDEYLAMFGIESFAEFLVLEFKEDGTCTTTAAGDEEPSTGTWKLDGNTIILTYEGEDSIFTVNGNELSFKEDDQDYLFVKK